MTARAPRLVVGFDGVVVPPRLRSLVERGWVAGVVVFARNLESTRAWCELQRELLALFPSRTPLVAVDQEGGLVQRVKPPRIPEVAPLPPMGRVAAALGPEGLEELGYAMGGELAALGFNVDLAPVLDVHSRPGNPIIGERAFGTTADAVIANALGWRRGLERAGVMACGKHLPGHGDTTVDSHLALPVDDTPLARLEAEAFRPFQAAIAAGVDLLMTAHVRFPALDAAWPATLSEMILRELVRGRWGYDGVLISDDLEMGALAGLREPGALVERLDAATVDLALVCRDLELAEALGEAIAAQPSDPVMDQRLGRLHARLRRHKAVWPLPDLPPRPAIGLA